MTGKNINSVLKVEPLKTLLYNWMGCLYQRVAEPLKTVLQKIGASVMKVGLLSHSVKNNASKSARGLQVTAVCFETQ